jgi:hypothetical protein
MPYGGAERQKGPKPNDPPVALYTASKTNSTSHLVSHKVRPPSERTSYTSTLSFPSGTRRFSLQHPLVPMMTRRLHMWAELRQASSLVGYAKSRDGTLSLTTMTFPRGRSWDGKVASWAEGSFSEMRSYCTVTLQSIEA